MFIILMQCLYVCVYYETVTVKDYNIALCSTFPSTRAPLTHTRSTHTHTLHSHTHTLHSHTHAPLTNTHAPLTHTAPQMMRKSVFMLIFKLQRKCYFKNTPRHESRKDIILIVHCHSLCVPSMRLYVRLLLSSQLQY